MIVTILFAGKTAVANAAELPIAGIDMVLHSFYQNSDNIKIDIKEYLTSDMSSAYKDVSFAQVTNYVNIRSKASEDSKILGKMYHNSSATILEEAGDWYKIKSGSVSGYIKSEYLITGAKAEALAKSIGTRIASVTATTLKIRKAANIEAPVITLVSLGEELTVIKVVDDWVKVSVNDEFGFVSDEYVELRTEFEEAISIEEEQERLEAEEAVSIEREQARLQEETAREEREQSQSIRTFSTEKASSNLTNTSNTAKSVSSNSDEANTSSIRKQLVEYALQFEGNPYVWGGTSLNNGVDCSGFTQSVFRDNGISIPRTSRSQATNGRKVSVDNIKPGDLIFYAKNSMINHVALYIGNGKVISASSPSTGIRIREYDYRQPYKAINYID